MEQLHSTWSTCRTAAGTFLHLPAKTYPSQPQNPSQNPNQNLRPKGTKKGCDVQTEALFYVSQQRCFFGPRARKFKRHVCVSQLFESLYITLILNFIEFNYKQLRDITSPMHLKWDKLMLNLRRINVRARQY